MSGKWEIGLIPPQWTKRQKAPNNLIHPTKRGAVFGVINFRVYGAVNQSPVTLLAGDQDVKAVEKNKDETNTLTS